jgi:hypothetical protein
MERRPSGALLIEKLLIKAGNIKIQNAELET